jgi:hypothetical protein
MYGDQLGSVSARTRGYDRLLLGETLSERLAAACLLSGDPRPKIVWRLTRSGRAMPISSSFFCGRERYRPQHSFLKAHVEVTGRRSQNRPSVPCGL